MDNENVLNVKADGETSGPAITAYATPEQLMDMRNFALHSAYGGVAQKVYFGMNGTDRQTWYIAGSDTDDSIILLCDPAKPMTLAGFDLWDFDNTRTEEKEVDWGNYEPDATPTSVYQNHYGASDLRQTLQKLAGNEEVFTSGEQEMMQSTKVYTYDEKNKKTYYTEDVLYPAYGDYYGDDSYITVGKNSANNLYSGQKVSIVAGPYGTKPSGYIVFWLRAPDDYSGTDVWVAVPGDFVDYDMVNVVNQAVVPAFNLDLSSVLFASTAPAASEGAALGDAMTFRLNGGEKISSSAVYSNTDVAVTKGTDSGDLYLYVQDADSMYSKKIENSTSINLSDMTGISSLSADSGTKIWLETTDDNVTYATLVEDYVENISLAEVSITAPIPGSSLDTQAECSTSGISSATPAVSYKAGEEEVNGSAGYNTTYTASFTLTAGEGYKFDSSISASNITINTGENTSETAASVQLLDATTLLVTWEYTTPKAKIKSITPPSDITGVASGTEKEATALGLPETVAIETEDPSVTEAEVTWDLDNLAEGTYDPADLAEQTFKVSGTVKLPEGIDQNGVELTTQIMVTVNKAETAAAPTADLDQSVTYKEDKEVTLTSSTPDAKIYYTMTTDGSDPDEPTSSSAEFVPGTPIEVTGSEGKTVTVKIKAITVKSGMYDSPVSAFTYTLEIPDTTSPTAEITINTKSWKEFLNTITFGTFFKNTQSVTITATDNESGVGTVEYFLSETNYDSIEALNDANVTWETYTDPFSIAAGSKQIVYAKVTDNAGNVTVVNSDGVVIYTDAEQVTSELTYIKNLTHADLEAEVALNGNTINEIKSGEADILDKDTDYTVDSTGKITFKKDYLDSLANGIYTLTVSYNPAGESYNNADGNDVPAVTTITLTIRDRKLTGIATPSGITGVANGTAKDASALGLPASVSVEAEDGSVTEAEIIWDLDNLAEGTYDPADLAEQTFKVNGTVVLPTGIEQGDVGLTIQITVTVDAAEDVNTQPEDPTPDNTGDNNTGDNNTGDNNTGDNNTGDNNTGDNNTDDSNTGDNNTGDNNAGDNNTGDNDTGNNNTGDNNTGNNNTGNNNTGNNNTGDNNTGNNNNGNNNANSNNTGNNNTSNNKNGQKALKTGDQSDFRMWSLALIAGLGGMTVLGITKKRKTSDR